MSALDSLEQGQHRLTCPDCGRGPKDRTFGVTVQPDGAAVGHCFRCEYVETHRPDRPVRQTPGNAPRSSAVPFKREMLSQYGAELFEACKGLPGTIGADYLTARGCVIPPADGDLRFHPSLKHPASEHTGPALVARVTHAQTQAPMTLHRTWIQANGQKADLYPPRMLLGGHSKKHGVIRLWPDECITYGLAVTEGIETALSLARAYQPVWSCIDAGNLAALPALPGLETLIIGADHDAAGLKGARTCADRWAAAGVDVRIIAPRAESQDWADRRAA